MRIIQHDSLTKWRLCLESMITPPIQTLTQRRQRFSPRKAGGDFSSATENVYFPVKFLGALSPTAGVDSALLLRDLRKALFIIFRVFFKRAFDFCEQATMKLFFLYAVAQKEHCVCFSPILAILPNLDRIAANLLRNFYEPGIVNVVAVAEKDVIVDRHQLNLQGIQLLTSQGHLHHVPELVREFRCRQGVTTDQLG